MTRSIVARRVVARSVVVATAVLVSLCNLGGASWYCALAATGAGKHVEGQTFLSVQHTRRIGVSAPDSASSPTDRNVCPPPFPVALAGVHRNTKSGASAAEPAVWSVSVCPTRVASVFDPSEEASMALVVRNGGAASGEIAAHWEIQDGDGRRLGAGKQTATLASGETRSLAVALRATSGRLPPGEYLAAQWRIEAGGRTVAEFRKGFGVLPPRRVANPAEPSPFGLLAEGDWPLLVRLGARRVRPNWSWAERPMDWARRYGVDYCPLVNEANAFVRGELSEQEYAEFVRQSVRRYKQYVRVWQLGNEFDVFHREGPKAFVESQRIGYAAAKAEDPRCVVLGGSITELQVRPAAWRETLQLGLARHCDIYDFHFYGDLKTTGSLLDEIHRVCRELHAEKPIWVTETTQVGMFDPGDHNQADYVFKRYAHLLGSGVDAVFWHALRWPYPFAADKTQATALVDYEGFARPSLFAYAAMTQSLADARFVRRWRIGENADVYAFEFSRENRSILALWTEGPAVPLHLRHTPGDVITTTPYGRRTTHRSPQGTLQVTAGKSPALYELPGPIDVSPTADTRIGTIIAAPRQFSHAACTPPDARVAW